MFAESNDFFRDVRESEINIRLNIDNLITVCLMSKYLSPNEKVGRIVSQGKQHLCLKNSGSTRKETDKK